MSVKSKIKILVSFFIKYLLKSCNNNLHNGLTFYSVFENYVYIII